MNKRLMLLISSVAVSVAILSGCSSKPASQAATTTTTTTTTTAAKTDAVAGASQTTDEASFEKAISKDNSNYMVIANKDLTFTKDLTVESGIKKGANGAADTVTRSLGLAVLDSNKKVAKKYTLAVPSLAIKGDNVKIEYGIVKGDVYVQGKGFTLKAATIDGNLYFANDDLKNAFKQDADTKITGQVSVKAYAAK